MQVSMQPLQAEGSVPATRSFVAGFFYAVIAILLCYCTLLQITRMERIHFTTHDDMGFDLLAQKIKNVGFVQGYLPQAERAAVNQGRFNYYLTIFFCAFPYFFENPLIRALVIVTIHISSLVALAGLLQHYVRLRFAILLITIQLVFLQHSWEHYPIGAGPVAHHIPILLCFLGALLYIRGMREDSSKKLRLSCSLSAYTLLFVSLLFYEALSLLFLVIFTAVILSKQQKAILSSKSRFRAAVKALAPLAVLVGAFLAMYFAYKDLHPSSYGGTVLQMKSWHNALSGLRVLRNLTVAGLPGAQAWTQDEMLQGLGLGPLRRERWGGFLEDNLDFVDFLQALLLTAALIGYRYFINSERGATFLPRRTVLAVAALALLCAITSSLPVAMTQKWQEEQPSAYVTSYFAYLSFSVVIALLVCVVSTAAGRRRRWGQFAFAALLVVSFVVSLLTSAANNAIVRTQVQYASKWRLMDAFLKTSVFHNLQEQTTILAPEMWQGVYKDEHYWSTYVDDRTGRSIQIAKTLPPQLPAGNAVAYMSFDLVRSDGACCALLAPVQSAIWQADPQGLLAGETIYIIGDRDIHNATLSYGTQPAYKAASGQLEIPARPILSHLETLVPDFREDNGAYVAEIQTEAPLITGTTSLTIRSALTIPRRQKIELFFGDGFYGTEGQEAPGHEYWRWSEGPGAQGQLTLYNYAAEPLAVRFQAKVEVATPKMTQFDVTFGPTTETAWVNNEGYAMERVLWLTPGANVVTLKSYAPRIDSPFDPRYMVFRLRNWKVQLLNAAEAAAVRKQSEQPLDLEFSKGFWSVEGTEGVGSNYYRWSDSPSGAGVITITNKTKRDIKATFQAMIATGVQPKTDFEVVVGAVRRNMLVDGAGQDLVLDLVVKPGRNDILLKSYAPRVPAPTDPRYLTFRVINWKLTYPDRGHH